MTPDIADSGSNKILAALPPVQLERLMQDAEYVTLDLDDVLGAPGQRIRHAHFPLDGFVALMAEAGDHDALALDLVGSEGMIGLPLALGVRVSTMRSRVHGAGSALRIGAANFERVLASAPALESRLLRYVGVRLEHLGRTALCASFHGVESRLAGWLLMAHDRAHGDRFYLTHDRLARVLGVRRSGVTTAAGVLQGREWISYTRGHIAVIDRPGLEGAACSCYREVHRRMAPRRPPVKAKMTIAPREMAVARHDPRAHSRN